MSRSGHTSSLPARFTGLSSSQTNTGPSTRHSKMVQSPSEMLSSCGWKKIEYSRGGIRVAVGADVSVGTGRGGTGVAVGLTYGVGNPITTVGEGATGAVGEAVGTRVLVAVGSPTVGVTGLDVGKNDCDVDVNVGTGMAVKVAVGVGANTCS